MTRFYIRARESLSEETATKAWTREVRRHPAAHEVNLRQELASEEFGHLMPAPHRFCEYDDTPKLTVVLVLAQDRVLLGLQHSKIDDGFAEGWYVDRYVAIQSGFLLRPWALSDVGYITVKVS